MKKIIMKHKNAIMRKAKLFHLHIKNVERSMLWVSAALIVWSGLIWTTQAFTIEIASQNLIQYIQKIILTADGGNWETLISLNQNNSGDAYFKWKVKANLFCDENGNNCKDIANLAITWTDIDTNMFVDNIDFDTTDGELSLTLSGYGHDYGISTYLDGRYALSGTIAESELPNTCSNGEIVKFNNVWEWVCAIDDVGTSTWDNDSDPLNEIQTISFSTDTLTLSNSWWTVNLSSYAKDADLSAYATSGHAKMAITPCDSDKKLDRSGTGWVCEDYNDSDTNTQLSTGEVNNMEVDPKIGSLSGNKIPYWSGTKLVNSIILLTGNQSVFIWWNLAVDDVFTTSSIESSKTSGSITFESNGDVNINKDGAWLNVGWSGTFGGNLYAQAFYYNSDIRYKKDLKLIDNPLVKISELNGYSFVWKHDGKKALGVIAQEVEKVFPELVTTKADGYKSVQYGNLVAPLIEAVKELHQENTYLKNKIKQLDERLLNLEE